MSSWRRPVAPVLACLALAALLAPPASAQDYFGQNKVRYQPFDFQVLRTEHFDIYYYSETKEVVPEAARMAERWYARISKALQHDLSRRQPLILYASHPAFEQTNAIYGDLGEGVGGVTEALKRRIVVPFAGPLAETDHVIGHELVHAFQYDIVGQGRSQTMGLMTAVAAAAVVHGGHGRVPDAGRGRPAHRDVDARRGPGQEAPELRPARGLALLPLPLRPVAVGLPDRPLRRGRRRPRAQGRGPLGRRPPGAAGHARRAGRLGHHGLAPGPARLGGPARPPDRADPEGRHSARAREARHRPHEPGPGALPRRPAARLLLGARPALDRDVPRGRREREGAAGHHPQHRGPRDAESRLHQLRRRVEPRRQALRLLHREPWPPRARGDGGGERPHRAAGAASRTSARSSVRPGPPTAGASPSPRSAGA